MNFSTKDFLANLSEQNKQDFKEILENLSRAANGIDISDEMILDVDALTEEEKFSLVRKYDIFMYLADDNYYDLSLMIALNLDELGVEEIADLSRSLKIYCL